MRISTFLSVILLDAVCTVSGTCLDQVSSNTMAIFNGAPFAFAKDYGSGQECAGFCDKLSECNAWLFSERGGECQLYKANALSTFKSQHFTYGICNGHRSSPASSSVAVAAVTSHNPNSTPSHSAGLSDRISLHVCCSLISCLFLTYS